MYIRTKTRINKSRKKYTYAYLAEMRQIRSKPTQRVKKYLGRVYAVEKIIKQQTKEWPQTLQEMLKEMIRRELKNHNFEEKGQDRWMNGDLEVNIDAKTVKNTLTEKKASIQMNQGILCDETLKKLVEYAIPKENMKRVGKDFAKTVVEAGLEASNEVIIEAFKKIQTMINNAQQ